MATPTACQCNRESKRLRFTRKWSLKECVDRVRKLETKSHDMLNDTLKQRKLRWFGEVRHTDNSKRTSQALVLIQRKTREICSVERGICPIAVPHLLCLTLFS